MREINIDGQKFDVLRDSQFDVFNAIRYCYATHKNRSDLNLIQKEAYEANKQEYNRITEAAEQKLIMLNRVLNDFKCGKIQYKKYHENGHITVDIDERSLKTALNNNLKNLHPLLIDKDYLMKAFTLKTSRNQSILLTSALETLASANKEYAAREEIYLFDEIHVDRIFSLYKIVYRNEIKRMIKKDANLLDPNYKCQSEVLNFTANRDWDSEEKKEEYIKSYPFQQYIGIFNKKSHHDTNTLEDLSHIFKLFDKSKEKYIYKQINSFSGEIHVTSSYFGAHQFIYEANNTPVEEISFS